MAYFMKHEHIEGESQVQGRKGFMELLSLSWGMSSSIAQRKGSQGSQGINVQDITCVKALDSTSSQIVQAFLRGAAAAVEIQFVTTGPNKKPQTILRIKLEDCVVTSYNVAGAGEDRPVETFSLNFSKFFYEVFGPDDALSGLSMTTGFDVFGGKPI